MLPDNMDSTMSYAEEVRDFVIENFLYGDGEQLTPEASFLGTGIVDSTGVLELVKFLEDNYSISIEDDEMVSENLDSLDNIDKFLTRKLTR